MNEVFQFLLENRSGYLATVDADGKPHARVIGLNFIEDGKLYYALSTQKGMYAQIQQKPDVELAVSAKDFFQGCPRDRQGVYRRSGGTEAKAV